MQEQRQDWPRKEKGDDPPSTIVKRSVTIPNDSMGTTMEEGKNQRGTGKVQIKRWLHDYVNP